MSTARPNIIVILGDQHRYDCTGLGGYPHARTPNLDDLGRRGMAFTHAFSPTPICCPARQSLLCGQYAPTHQGLTNYDNGEITSALTPATPTYSARLKEAGYASHFVGQWHVSPVFPPVEFGFDHYVPLEDYGPWRAAQNLPWPPVPAGHWRATDPAPEEKTRQHWLGDRAIESIRALARSGQPFHLRVDTLEPHLPHIIPEPWASLVDPASLPPWPSFADTFENKPWIQRQMLAHWNTEDWTWEQNFAPILAYYLGSIAQGDAQIGRIMNALAEEGILENTLIIYTADHGELGGAHHMLDKHVTLYDDTVRVPFYAHWPAGLAQSGMVSDAFVTNTVDVPATILAAAGCPIPDTMQGRSLLPLFAGAEPAGWPQAAFGTLHGSQFGSFTQRMARDRDYKYILNATDIDELYDLKNDPHELRNLAVDPAHANTLQKYRLMLLDWAKQTRDPLLYHPKHGGHPSWLAQTLLQGKKINTR